MKKLITLLTIVAVAIGCALTSLDCDAKTKKKRAATHKTTAVSRAKTPTSAGLTIDDLCYYFRDQEFGIVFSTRMDEDIITRLKKKGFEVDHRTETRIQDEMGVSLDDSDTYEANIYTFTKSSDAGTTRILLDFNIVIDFPTIEDARVFMDGVKKFGYKHDSTGWHDPSECYYNGTDIETEGSQVKIIVRCGE